jgi:endonuclease/exonuclease/phosphatase family metal-dependent hydrolase
MAARLLAFNIEYGAQGYALERAAAVIREARADVAAIAEAKTEAGENSADRLAALLGWHGTPVLVNGSAVISRWPVRAAGEAAARVAPPGRPAFYVVSAHFDDYPYQPFQAEEIPYCLDEAQCQRPLADGLALVGAAQQARGAAVARVAAQARRLARRAPVAILGDFNEPSHLDWTARAAAAGRVPRPVDFPASRLLYGAGFVDAYRSAHPDEVADPGTTWPVGDPGYPFRPDRIDFIYVRTGDRVVSCEPVAGSPSDHRAVVAEVVFGGARDGPAPALAAGPGLPVVALLAAALLTLILIATALLFGAWRRVRAKNTGRALSRPGVPLAGGWCSRTAGR